MTRSIRRSHFLVFSLLVAMVPLQLRAQIGTGTISGVVTDSSGAVLAGATLAITNVETGTVTNTVANPQGRYLVPDLPVGIYQVKAARTGFQTQIFKDVHLTVGSSVVVDCKLSVGQELTTISVEVDPSQVDTSTSQISAVIARNQMENLPLNGRNFEQLILLAPGVQSVTTGTMNSFYGRENSYSIAGSRPEGQELLLDGATIQGFWGHGAGNSIIGTSLGVEGIGEFQILTNSYSARFGGSGSVMNATTRSGTNSLHGSVYDFLRNSALDARNYFNPSTAPQDAFRQNQFGGTIGGPMVKDKMFFFANYEGVRRLLGETVIGTVPNASTRQGIVPCPDAPDLTCQPDGTATVPLNPASQAILNLYPVSSSPAIPGSPIVPISLRGSQPANEDYFNVRWDYHASERDTFFTRYIIDNGSLTDPFASTLGLYPEESRGRNQYLTLGYTRVVSPSLVNDARFSFVRTNMRAFTNVSNPALQFFSSYGENRQDGNVNVPGFSPIGPSNFTPNYEVQNTFSLSDGMFWTRGKHSLEIGLEFRRLQSPLANGYFDDQGWTFPNIETFLEGQPVLPPNCNPTIDPSCVPPPITLLAALPGKSDSVRSFREWDLFPYIQDTWKVSDALTLNFGVRYNFISNPTEIHNQLCAFVAPSDPATTSCTPVKHVFPSNPSMKSIDPRVGIVWDPFKNQKTSVHAGAGLFHDPIQVRNYHPAYIFSTPYQTAVSLCVYGGPPCSYPVPFQGITVPIPTIGEALEYNPGTTPFIFQYNFGIEHDLGKNTMLSVSYVGSHGYNLLVQNDTNPPIPNMINGQPNFLNAPRKNPNLGAIAFNIPDGSSRYDSLQLYLTRNVGRTLRFQASHTYSKCIDYGSISYGLQAGNSGQQARSNPYDLAADKGPCDFNIKHNFTGSATYSLPFQGNRLIEGWQVSTILMAHTGSPFSVQDGIDIVGLNDPAGQPGERPNLVPGRSSNPIVGRVNEWYDPTAFALQDPGFIGTLGRNTLVGPKFVDLDLSFAKMTKISERTSLEFRAEAFNLFNHPNFGLPGQILTSGLAGVITGTVGTQREVQFAAKFLF